MSTTQHAIITSEALQALLDTLLERRCRVIGPTVRDQAIVYDDIASVAELPKGWTDEQDGGRYRLARRDDDALFGCSVGPHSWKKFLHPPVLRLWRTERYDGERAIVPEPDPEARFAFIGVRACELHAIAIQDRVFLGGPHTPSDLASSETSRSRRWDSCFTMDFSYIHGGSVRSSTRSRYRQWMTHKLATWLPTCARDAARQRFKT
jgi:hypothetical protein